MGDRWTSRERALLDRLRSPWSIQQWLDRVPYSTDPVYRSARSVMRDRRAHCVDGGLFAAAALRRLGFPPLVVWITAENDDGHLTAIFRVDGRWGAVAKSNFLTIRYREPVYRSLGELMMSYFDGYFNALGQRTMRGHTRPLNLAKFDALAWPFRDDRLDEIVDGAFDRLPVIPVVSRSMVRRLNPLDRRTARVILKETDRRGLFNARAN